MRINLPPCTRTLLIVLIGLTLLNDILLPNAALAFFTRIGHGSPYLSLVPGRSFKFPWTMLTATFVEQNIFGLLVTGLTVFFGGRYLERAWGTYEFAKFIAIISLIPNLACFLLYLVLYGVSHTQASM
jgi:membrane associated rhomboid family serine protease